MLSCSCIFSAAAHFNRSGGLMITLPMHSSGALTNTTLSSVNQAHTFSVVTADNILSLNTMKKPGNTTGPNQSVTSPQTAGSFRHAPSCQNTNQIPSAQSANGASVTKMPVPVLNNPVLKGQKASLANGTGLRAVEACFGWNVTNAACDVDVSAFLLSQSGKVIGDSWFVFYGQTISPDKSIRFFDRAKNDREMISIDFTKLNPAVQKIAFVLTINEAFEKKLHFGMIQDAYVRIMDAGSNRELIGFRLTETYSNVISMMIGELYRYNGIWKFNAAGNGLARDLAGLCEFYGVQVI